MKWLYYTFGIGLVFGIAFALWPENRQFGYQSTPQTSQTTQTSIAVRSPAPESATVDPTHTSSALTAPPIPPDPSANLVLDAELQPIVDEYIETLRWYGLDVSQHGIWVESSQGTLAEYQGKMRFSAASLTKLATTLLALDHWGPDYRFYTRIAKTGELNNGVLNGDLIVKGGADPFYVWESAIALGNRLNQLGIQQVTGRLVIDGLFVMNFERDRAIAGELLRQALDSNLWTYEAYTQYQTLPPGTPEPQVSIAGGIVIEPVTHLEDADLLIEQPSLPLAALLKQMNIYSNNIIAQILLDLIGGSLNLEEGMVKLANIPPEEIQFINGSGLGPENQISPRGVCQILSALSDYLKEHNLGLPDVLPIANQDPGTLEIRTLPDGIMAKTGTLWNVSTLGGVVPTGDRPVQFLDEPDTLCFAIMNQGSTIDLFYDEQDSLVSQLKTTLQTLQTANSITNPLDSSAAQGLLNSSESQVPTESSL